MQLPFMLDGERHFIEREFVAVGEDHDVIIGQPNKEAVAEDRSTAERECQMEIALRL